MVQVATVHLILAATPEGGADQVVVRVGRAEHNPHTYSRPAVETTVDMEGRPFGVLLLPQV
jgi:hypothetical protein